MSSGLRALSADRHAELVRLFRARTDVFSTQLRALEPDLPPLPTATALASSDDMTGSADDAPPRPVADEDAGTVAAACLRRRPDGEYQFAGTDEREAVGGPLRSPLLQGGHTVVRADSDGHRFYLGGRWGRDASGRPVRPATG